jgi:2-keto-4-pentenoate hydratase/2-oxohepta-3-ene-1,7-dioic acid hydratase in catechol pathway
MRIASFTHDGRARWGLIEGDQMLDVTAVEADLPPTLMGALWRGLDDVAAIAQSAPRLPLDAVRLRAPIARPGKILAIGKNYHAHNKEMGSEAPASQLWFNKQTTAVAGPYDPLPYPKGATQLDYEGELVAVIGRTARHVAREDALSYVAGLCVGCDFSERVWQSKSATFILGKGQDGFAPFGPWLTTPDEAGPIEEMTVRTWVNGEIRQQDSCASMIHSLADQIAEVSSCMTLEPGDVIFTGTPAGVAAGMKPQAWLKPGDLVRIEITGLGALEIRIAA